MGNSIRKTIIWVVIFSLAMGYMEAIVVVYLRRIYYPAGFDFPLVPVDYEIAACEFFREIATITMLVGIGVLAGRTRLQRFAYFLLSFAVWDIFYYVFLKVALGWPASLFTWDILFLVPVPWVGPVIAPCLVSLTMALLALILIIMPGDQRQRLTGKELIMLIAGSLVCMLSFMWDYILYLSASATDRPVWTLTCRQEMFSEIRNYVPTHFNWSLFGAGEILLLIAVAMICTRLKKETTR